MGVVVKVYRSEGAIKITSTDETALIKFKYDVETVSKIKTLPLRMYLPETKEWEIPIKDVPLLKNLFEPDELDFYDELDEIELVEEEPENPWHGEGGSNEGHNVFTTELGYIQSTNIRKFAIAALDILPEYFYHVPASSTGKYHPNYCLGEGGLVRHTKAAVHFAKELFNFNTYWNFSLLEQDIIITALLLHDGLKHGEKESQYAKADHAVIAANFIERELKASKIVPKAVFEKIQGCIASHMSQWNTEWNNDKVVAPLPKTDMQKFTGLCDYLASRKSVEVTLE